MEIIRNLKKKYIFPSQLAIRQLYFARAKIDTGNTVLKLFELEKQEQGKVQNLHRKCFASRVLSFKPEIENTNILADV